MNQLNSEEYNDQNYPIEPIWALKSTLPSFIALPFILAPLLTPIAAFIDSPYGSGPSIKLIIYLTIYTLTIPLHFFTNLIRRATFHYQFEKKFLRLEQGLIRKQSRQLPFGVIQNVIVTRGLFDRLFGLATITIQNAAQSIEDFAASIGGNTKSTETAGFSVSTIQIPGLTEENAEKIKNELLKRIKESPIVELGM